MANIFISHSSKDKDFVRKLAKDIETLGHTPWLDEWEIKIGDCIASEIEKGIERADYIIVVLSPNSISSGWVDREWKSKYWNEVESGHIQVLPILIETCKIPLLLRTKKYADFRENYSTSLVTLMSTISSPPTSNRSKESIPRRDSKDQVTSLIELVQSRNSLLSQSIARVYRFALEHNQEDLIEFCKNELSGWPRQKPYKIDPIHRVIQVYVAIGHEINPQYFGWNGNTSSIISHIQQNPDEFIPTKMILPYPLSKIEHNQPNNPNESILSIRGKSGDFLPGAENPNIPVNMYAPASVYGDLIESVRRQLTQHLLEFCSSTPDQN